MNNSDNWDVWQDEPYRPIKRETRKRVAKYSKKPKKSFLVIIAVLVFICIALDRCGNSGSNTIIRNDKQENEDSENKKTAFQYYYYGQLSNAEQRDYDLILEAMNNMDSKVNIQENNNDIIAKITSAIILDHPELFWCDGFYRYSIYNDYTEYMPSYICSLGDRDTKQQKIDVEAHLILDQIQDNWSDYEKIKFVFEKVIESVDYVTGSPDNQNIYSSLVNKKSVCAGYTRACQYLLHKINIECLYVSGMVNETESHAWNIVKCNGNYYQMDATFGDRAFDSNPQNNRPEELGINYAYLCCSDSEMYIDRYADVIFSLPVCNFKDLNYYKKYEQYYDYYSEAVMEELEKSIFSGKKVWQCQFSNFEAYQSMLNRVKSGALAEIVGRYLQSIGYNESLTTWYMEDDGKYTIACWY